MTTRIRYVDETDAKMPGKLLSDARLSCRKMAVSPILRVERTNTHLMIKDFRFFDY